eukprot:3675462-Pyramimonas_sp.AAC.2
MRPKERPRPPRERPHNAPIGDSEGPRGAELIEAPPLLRSLSPEKAPRDGLDPSLGPCARAGGAPPARPQGRRARQTAARSKMQPGGPGKAQ